MAKYLGALFPINHLRTSIRTDHVVDGHDRHVNQITTSRLVLYGAGHGRWKFLNSTFECCGRGGNVFSNLSHDFFGLFVFFLTTLVRAVNEEDTALSRQFMEEVCPLQFH